MRSTYTFYGAISVHVNGVGLYGQIPLYRTHLVQTPHYYGQFALFTFTFTFSLRFSKFNLINTDTLFISNGDFLWPPQCLYKQGLLRTGESQHNKASGSEGGG